MTGRIHFGIFTIERIAFLAAIATIPFCLGQLVRGEDRDQRNPSRPQSSTKTSVLEQVTDTESAEAVQRELRVGIAVMDITPPEGFPMAGYYHERLAEGTIDPLQAKAIVFRDEENDTAAALVVCDLIGIASDLSREVRRQASERTGIPAPHIVIAATHSHTAPDYMKELWLHLGNEPQDPRRKAYIEKLISKPVEAIAKAHAEAAPRILKSGSGKQDPPVSFNRRFVMRDGSVRTWMNWENPDVVRAAGPVDPEIGLLAIYPLAGDPADPAEEAASDGATTPGTSETQAAAPPTAILSNFALHLDTVGGSRWSADYPHFIEQTLRQAFGPNMVSIFGTGCCGDINHVDPHRRERNKADFIGNSIGESIRSQIDQLTPIEQPRLSVKSDVVHLPLQDAAEQEVERSVQLLQAAKREEQIDFFDHVTAYKKLILDQLRHPKPYVETSEHITWGLSRSLAGIGETLPTDVTVIAIGSEVAIVCLPGEVFVDLGLAIKQASPFQTTLIVELANQVETIYVPHRAAYAGGSYEVTNSTLEPGSGEMLVESAIRLLREAATSLDHASRPPASRSP